MYRLSKWQERFAPRDGTMDPELIAKNGKWAPTYGICDANADEKKFSSSCTMFLLWAFFGFGTHTLKKFGKNKFRDARCIWKLSRWFFFTQQRIFVDWNILCQKKFKNLSISCKKSLFWEKVSPLEEVFSWQKPLSQIFWKRELEIVTQKERKRGNNKNFAKNKFEHLKNF